MIFETIKNFLLDLLFPKLCLGCGRNGDLICRECLGKINFLQNQQCPACRRQNLTGDFCGPQCGNEFYFDQLIVCCEYGREAFIRKLITSLKYRFIKECDYFLAEVMRTQFFYISQSSLSGESLRDAIFVPVPIHKKRLLYRGFNQSKILAEKLLTILKTDPDTGDLFKNLKGYDCLIRSQYSHEQATLGRNERLDNLTGSIKLEEKFSEKIRDKLCILVDDVATTCSTLNECGKILKQNGARYVCGLVVARGA